MSSELDKDILATMSPEEREAIEGEASPEELAVMRASPAGEGGDANDDDDDAVDDAGEDDAAAVTAEAAPAAAATDEAAAVVADEVDADDADAAPPEFRPRYKAELPADYADQVSAVKTESDALAKAFKAGDIDFDEYQVQSQDIAERREALTILRAKSEIAEEMGGQTAEQEWGNTISQFFAATAKAGGTDYAKDAAKQADLDQFVKVLASNPANDDKSGEWYLAEAHKRVNALHGLAAAKVDVPPVVPPKRGKPAIPATSLAHVPGGEGPGDLAGEFADMDGLEGDALETAIAKMTPAQREKYSMTA